MKKVLVATCVVAMTAFGITNASADPMVTARANAYGLDVGGSLLSGLVEREPEVTSVLPPGGLAVEDIITVPADPLVINGTGVVVAETSAESDIVPFMPIAGGADGATTGGGGGGTLGGIFDELLNLGGGGGALPTGVVGANSAGSEGQVQTQQLDGLTGDGGGGVLGGVLGGDTLGGLLDQGDGGATELVADGEIIPPVVNARGFARIDDLNVVVDDADAFTGLPEQIVAILVDALLEVDVISAEAVAVCAQNQVFFDTAASVVMLQDESVSLVDDLVNTLGEILPEELVSVKAGEVIVGPDGVGVNALHVTILGLPDTGVATTLPEVTTTTVVAGTAGTESLPTDDLVEIQQVDDGDGGPLLDIVIGHAEVSGSQCVPPSPPPLEPTGPGPILPRTGGLGILPAVLGVGLLGGAVAAGRFALRSRGNGDSL